jgi:methyltransferase (TIGR00027 family)
LHYKTQILQHITPTCTYHPVPGDLAKPDSQWVTNILRAGYQATAPTIWLIEGVVMYLQEEEVHLLLRTISKLSVAGSVLGMDGVKVGSILAGQKARKSGRGRVIQHWQFGHDIPEQLLARYGWTAIVSEPKDIKEGHGRYPASMPMGTGTGTQEESRGVWLVHAVKE